MSRRKLDSIYARARREAYPVVRAAIVKALPKGWRCVLAVGWGVTVFDAEGRTVDRETYANKTHGHSPTRMPAALKRALVLAEHFEELYGLGNESIPR